jgi:hypothetical protein
MAIISTIRQRNAVFLLIAALALSSCAGAQRVDNANQFANEGVKFTQTLPAFYDEYFKLAINADSAALVTARELSGAAPERLQNELQKADDDLKRTGALVRGLTEHASLLGSYFAEIQRLTGEDVGQGVGSATAALVGEIGRVRSDFGRGSPLGVPVEKVAQPVGNFVVVALKNKALKRELEEHGETIDRELAVQEAILNKLGQSMVSDSAAWTSGALINPVYEQYRDKSKPLGTGWYRKRERYLTNSSAIGSAQQAEQAMKALRVAWQELAGGGPEGSTVTRLMGHVDATIAMINALKAN